MFADADLQSIAEVIPVRQYPDGLIEAVAGIDPAIPWLYTGGLENHPDVVAAISEQRALWGNNAAVLQLVRDPTWVRDVLSEAGLPALDVFLPESRGGFDHPPTDGSWIAKPLKGAGGRGVCVWNEAAAQLSSLNDPRYFQQHVTGDSLGALFVASGGRTQLIGITRQLVGLTELGAIPFAYCGSIGPVFLEESTEKMIRTIGDAIGHAASLRGLFGCDFVLDGETPWLVEVNPRYTASTEILELASGEPLLKWHHWACIKDELCVTGHSDFSPEGVGVDSPGRSPGFRVPTDVSAPTGRNSRTSKVLSRPVGASHQSSNIFPGLRPGLSNQSPLGPRPGCGLPPHELLQLDAVKFQSSLIGKAIVYADRELVAPRWPVRMATSSLSMAPFLADIPHAESTSPTGWPLCTVFATGRNSDEVLNKLIRRATRVRARFLESEPIAS